MRVDRLRKIRVTGIRVRLRKVRVGHAERPLIYLGLGRRNRRISPGDLYLAALVRRREDGRRWDGKGRDGTGRDGRGGERTGREGRGREGTVSIRHDADAAGMCSIVAAADADAGRVLVARNLDDYEVRARVLVCMQARIDSVETRDTKRYTCTCPCTCPYTCPYIKYVSVYLLASRVGSVETQRAQRCAAGRLDELVQIQLQICDQVQPQRCAAGRAVVLRRRAATARAVAWRPGCGITGRAAVSPAPQYKGRLWRRRFSLEEKRQFTRRARRRDRHQL